MTKLDLAYSLTGETRDQFHVPGRETEVTSFVCSGMLGMAAAGGPFLVPLKLTNVGLLIAVAALAAMFLARAIKQRRFRLTRIREVEELKYRLAGTGTELA